MNLKRKRNKKQILFIEESIVDLDRSNKSKQDFVGWVAVDEAKA